MSMSIEDMQKLLLQMQQATQELQQKLQIATENQNPYYLPSRINNTTYHWDKNHNNQDIKAKHYQFLNYEKNYSLITITFDPSISKRLSQDEQVHSLTHVIRTFDQNQYFACLEKHMNGILHAHMLVVDDPVKIIDKMHKVKSRVTPSRKLMPAINIKSIPPTQIAINRTYNYIFDDKKDHPIFKHLIINI